MQEGLLNLLHSENNDISEFLHGSSDDEQLSAEYSSNLTEELHQLNISYLSAWSSLLSEDITTNYAGVFVLEDEYPALQKPLLSDSDPYSTNNELDFDSDRFSDSQDFSDISENDENVIFDSAAPKNTDKHAKRYRLRKKEPRSYAAYFEDEESRSENKENKETLEIYDGDIFARNDYDLKRIAMIRREKVLKNMQSRKDPFDVKMTDEGYCVVGLDLKKKVRDGKKDLEKLEKIKIEIVKECRFDRMKQHKTRKCRQKKIDNIVSKIDSEINYLRRSSPRKRKITEFQEESEEMSKTESSKLEIGNPGGRNENSGDRSSCYGKGEGQRSGEVDGEGVGEKEEPYFHELSVKTSTVKNEGVLGNKEGREEQELLPTENNTTAEGEKLNKVCTKRSKDKSSQSDEGRLQSKYELIPVLQKLKFNDVKLDAGGEYKDIESPRNVDQHSVRRSGRKRKPSIRCDAYSNGQDFEAPASNYKPKKTNSPKKIQSLKKEKNNNINSRLKKRNAGKQTEASAICLSDASDPNSKESNAKLISESDINPETDLNSSCARCRIFSKF